MKKYEQVYHFAKKHSQMCMKKLVNLDEKQPSLNDGIFNIDITQPFGSEHKMLTNAKSVMYFRLEYQFTSFHVNILERSQKINYSKRKKIKVDL